LDEIYPDWRDEYSEPKLIEDAHFSDIELYQHYMEDLFWKEYENNNKIYGWEASYGKTNAYKSFDKTKSVYYEYATKLGRNPKELYTNWEKYNPLAPREEEHIYETFIDYSPLFFKLFKNRHKGEILMFSRDENPDYEYMKKIRTIANNYHLG